MAVFVADEQEAVALDLDGLSRLAEHVLGAQGVPDAMEVNVLCVERDVIAELNERHLGSRGPTDVLAFPLDLPGESLPGEPAILGDVVLCPEVARRQAPAHGKDTEAELALLLVHGILHLLGHDHADPESEAEMFGLTDRLLASFGQEAAR